MMDRRGNQRGAALLIVLILAATASVIAVALVDDLAFAVRRTANVAARDQARWHALGAESLVATLLQTEYETQVAAGRDAFRQNAEAQWNAAPTRFPIDGGEISARIEDDTRCFNLNSLVRLDNGDYAADPDAVDQYRLLLAAVGVSGGQAQALIDGVVDWLDTDDSRSPVGAEDDHYRGLKPPYATADALFVDVGELRAVRGYTREVYAVVAPYLCAHPGEAGVAPSPVNVNLLTEAHGPIVYMLADGRVSSPREAARFAASIPPEGFAAASDFWDALRAVATEPDPATQTPFRREEGAPVQIWSKYYRLTTRVAYYGAYMEAGAALTMSDQGRVTTTSRHLGAEG